MWKIIKNIGMYAWALMLFLYASAIYPAFFTAPFAALYFIISLCMGCFEENLHSDLGQVAKWNIIVVVLYFLAKDTYKDWKSSSLNPNRDRDDE